LGKNLSPCTSARPETVGGARDHKRVTETPLADAHRLLAQAMSAVAAVAESGADHQLVSLLTLCEGATRQLDRITVDAIAVLDRRALT
jgi:hypothetical protein